MGGEIQEPQDPGTGPVFAVFAKRGKNLPR